MDDVQRDVQRRNLLALAQSPGGFQFTKTFFPYTSGEIGPYYVQSAAIMADGHNYAIACEDMANMVRDTLGQDWKGIISGGESRDWVFSGPVAGRLHFPGTWIYKDGKVIGASMKDNNVAHVADLNNEGSSPRDLWMPVIKREGGNIRHIFFYVDRLEDGVDVMKQLGLESHSIIPLDEYAWDQLQIAGTIDKETYQSLRLRMEDKEKWAERMLRSAEGIETLIALVASGKTREKGLKVLASYPNLRDELTCKIKQYAPGVRRWLE